MCICGVCGGGGVGGGVGGGDGGGGNGGGEVDETVRLKIDARWSSG